MSHTWLQAICLTLNHQPQFCDKWNKAEIYFDTTCAYNVVHVILFCKHVIFRSSSINLIWCTIPNTTNPVIPYTHFVCKMLHFDEHSNNCLLITIFWLITIYELFLEELFSVCDLKPTKIIWVYKFIFYLEFKLNCMSTIILLFPRIDEWRHS